MLAAEEKCSSNATNIPASVPAEGILSGSRIYHDLL
jgi:hypothetical protein